MASGFFALLDDIATLMDDVVVMSKITTKKTAGILGDDLAVNAEKATGFISSRELPVLWAITKGSMLNKLIILPIAFLLSAFVPWAVTLILVLGGVYLAFEGAEKIYGYFIPHHHEKDTEIKPSDGEKTILEIEKKKIKSAIFTDFILSVEIIIIALIATVGVYGIVALIVRMDDLGYRLVEVNANKKNILKAVGFFLINALPWVIKGLSVIGTMALLLVAGGIFVHNITFLHHFLESVPGFLRDFLLGLLIGITALFMVKALKAIRGSFR